MFILLLLCLLQLEVAFALPTPQSMDGSSPTQADSNSNLSTRSTSDIFWSCITTIFACTWVAVHPNLPSPHDSDWRLFWRRVKILGVALIAPEFIIVWALNQLRSALYSLKKLRRFDACKHWTVAHGMFLVMGGFVLADESGTRIEVLQAVKLDRLLSNHVVTLPHIPESEIMDRSKGDALAKALVLIQTTWFIAQVVSRAVLHLPITELELTTVAFALLNFLTYALWWKKPLDVRHPINITLRCSLEQAAALDLPISTQLSSESFSLQNYGISPTVTLEVNSVDSGYSATNRPASTASSNTLTEMGPSLSESRSSYLPPSPDDLGTREVDALGAKRKRNEDSGALPPDAASINPQPQSRSPSVFTLWFNTLCSCYHMIVKLMVAMIPPFARPLGVAYRKICAGFISPMNLLAKKEVYIDKVPIFYAGDLGNVTSLFYPTNVIDITAWAHWALLGRIVVPAILEMFIGALFGSIHCAAWAFHFPSKVEQILWRTMSLCITLIPMALMMLVPATAILAIWTRYTFLSRINLFILPVYVVARLITLVLAFVLLRDLPDGAFQEVQWTSYIPHV
ncbi:hypothetical protein D9757_013521 [Collybiopsis confluens]|uniref:PIN-like protein n=1 Tax=Collybiopsis confluens TaxID=2823264 RepID=A0A8H5G1B7_9AGAR|nr:hypothetical protein D9757_013521 [Collybiopsis confluens]